MPLMIRLEDNRFVPSLVCEICKERIVSLNDGNVYYERFKENNIDGEYFSVFLTHKGVCSANLEADFGNLPWMETDEFLSFLLQNIGILPSKVYELFGKPSGI